jgi:molybdenum cofactor cytidylyltransferase
MIPSDTPVAIVLLAAGRASRMEDQGHKLLAEFDGVPLVRRCALAALGSKAAPLVVITGCRAPEIEDALASLPITAVRNPDFDDGIATSIRAAFTEDRVWAAAGVMVVLADMPNVSTAHLDLLLEHFERHPDCVVRSTSGGQPGNPVILPRSMFDSVGSLTGDMGARELIRQSDVRVVGVEIGEAGHADVDTVESLIALGGRLTT